MIKIDSIGDICPIPIIKLKNALKEIETGEVVIQVDNIISKENVEKFARELGYKYISYEKSGVYTISIEKIKTFKSESAISKENIVIVVASDTMGEGDKELGKTLIKGFFYTLTEIEKLPKTIIFYNKGVLLVAENQDIIKDLKLLEKRGVEILSCGACANFYKVENSISVGSITNMYTIINKQLEATKVIKP